MAASGPNELTPTTKEESLWHAVLEALADPMVLFLLVAGVIYVITGDRFEATFLFGAIVPVLALNLSLEQRSLRTLRGLRAVLSLEANVVRDGVVVRIASRNLVPGDVLVLAEGDEIAADAIVLSGHDLQVNQAVFTGEPEPVEKPARALLFAGTTLLTGSGFAEVTTTGRHTRYGELVALAEAAKRPPTPVEQAVRRFVFWIAIVAIITSVIICMLEVIRGHGWERGIVAAMTLLVASLPEEFPAAYTLFLAFGNVRMARSHAVARDNRVLEALGAVTAIATDKTGTLTEGRLTLSELWHPTSSDDSLVRAALAACDAQPIDPLERAIFELANARLPDAVAWRLTCNTGAEYPFSATLRRHSHELPLERALFVKGAPDAILTLCKQGPIAEAAAAVETLAGRAFRVLAVARRSNFVATGTREIDEADLELLGLLAFRDPVRAGIAESVAACRKAGIDVWMMTGDHPTTAAAIAREVGIAADRVLARLEPAQKLAHVERLLAAGEVVAVTGDGVNDVPALRRASVGIAMGMRGSPAAREAGSLVLLDDSFRTLADSLWLGRGFELGLRQCFGYLTMAHAAIILSALLLPLLGAPLVYLPIHIVWFELIVHPTMSFAFQDPLPASELQRHPPRRGALLTIPEMSASIGVGTLLGILILALYFFGRRSGEAHGRALAMAALFLGNFAMVLALRLDGIRRASRWTLVALMLPVASLLLAFALPAARSVVQITPLAWNEWILAASAALATGVLARFLVHQRYLAPQKTT